MLSLFFSHTSYYVVKLQRQGKVVVAGFVWNLRHVTLLYVIQFNVISVTPCIYVCIQQDIDNPFTGIIECRGVL